jgi:predicted DNA-binding protein
MATVSIRIDDDIKLRLNRMAELTGMSRASILREAMLDKMEELEDHLVAAERLAKPFRSVSNEDVWETLA